MAGSEGNFIVILLVSILVIAIVTCVFKRCCMRSSLKDSRDNFELPGSQVIDVTDGSKAMEHQPSRHLDNFQELILAESSGDIDAVAKATSKILKSSTDSQYQKSRGQRTASAEELESIQDLIHAPNEQFQNDAERKILTMSSNAPKINFKEHDLENDAEIKVVHDLIQAETNNSPMDILKAQENLLNAPEYTQKKQRTKSQEELEAIQKLMQAEKVNDAQALNNAQQLVLDKF